MIRYQDASFRYVWKPPWMPSTWWERHSLLDELFVYQQAHSTEELSMLIAWAIDVFGKEKELGLVNRLDNATSGLLYFAKTTKNYDMYKHKQSVWEVVKHYLADVSGRVDNPMLICTPLMHHQHEADRMVARRWPQDDGKVRGKKHYVETYIEPMIYDTNLNITTLSIMIAQWMRHQIRVHCASIGAPLVWDSLYNKKNREGALHLWSVGLSF